MGEFEDLGFKLTPKRIAILRILEGNKTHPSAEDIYRAVLKSIPTTSFATIYNTLNTLKESGKIIELSIDPDRKRFDPNTSPHHHLMCVKCKKIVDIHKEYQVELSEEERQGFEIVGNHVEIFGTCPKCKGDRYKNQAKWV